MGSVFSGQQQPLTVPITQPILYNTQPSFYQPSSVVYSTPLVDTTTFQQQQPFYTTQFIPPIQSQPTIIGGLGSQPMYIVGQDIQPKPQPGPDPCPGPEEFQQQVENDPNIAQIIDQIVQNIPPNLCGVHPPQHRREQRVVTSNCPPRVANIRRRLPSPGADIVERTTLIRSPQDKINIIIEKPTMPPACVIENTQIDTSMPPRISQQVVCVQPTQRECPTGTIPDQFTVASRYQAASGMQQPLQFQYQQPYQQQSAFQPFQQQPYQQIVPTSFISKPYIPSSQQMAYGANTMMTQPQVMTTTPYLSTAKPYQQSSRILSSSPLTLQPSMNIQSGLQQQQSKYYWPQTTTQMMSSSDTSDMYSSPRISPTWYRGIV